MFRVLMFIALVAAMAGVYDFAGTHGALAGVGAVHGAAGSLTLDVRSFGMGFAAALLLATMQRIPWHGLPTMLRDWLRGWRRLFQLAVLAALLIGVLMFY